MRFPVYFNMDIYVGRDLGTVWKHMSTFTANTFKYNEIYIRSHFVLSQKKSRDVRKPWRGLEVEFLKVNNSTTYHDEATYRITRYITGCPDKNEPKLPYA